MKASVFRQNTSLDSLEIPWKMYRLNNHSYLWFLRTSADRAADPGSIADRANAEGKIESKQVES